jgi:glycosyltransferase involved in cell wall biosynthesis
MRTLYTIASDLGGPGIGTTSFNAAAGLHRAKHLASLACLRNAQTEIEAEKITEIPFYRDGWRRFVPDKFFFSMKNKRFDKGVQKLLKNGGETFDTLHAWNSQATDAVKLAKKMGVKIVIDRASTHINTQTKILTEAHEHRGLHYRPLSKVIDRCLEDYDLADRIVVPSQHAWQSFIDEGVDEVKLVINPFGFDIPEGLKPVSQEKRDPFRVLFVGQVGVRKGVLDILEAWDDIKLEKAELIIVGGLEKSAERVFQRWFDRGDIFFTGFSADVFEHMANAHIFCFPSLEEGSALVTYEAMAHGLPMIVTAQAGSVAEYGKSALFVPPGDPKAIGAAIKKLYNDSELSTAIGHLGRQRVEDYTWKAYGERTAKLHEELAGSSSSPESAG